MILLNNFSLRTLSILFKTTIVLSSENFNESKFIFFVTSIKNNFKSLCFILSIVFLIPFFSITFFACCLSPAVSKKIIGIFERFTFDSIISLVVPAILEIIDTSFLTS